MRSPSTTTIKRHPSDVKLSYTYQFQPVHSVGVIIAWLCFTFITVEILDPNLILRFAFAPPISIPVTVGFCRLLWFYVKCLKRRIIGKNVFFELCILEMVWEIFFKFEMWLLLKRGHLHSKFGAIQIRNHGTTYVRKRENRNFASCQYNSPCCSRTVFLGRTTHYHVSWYFLPDRKYTIYGIDH